VPPSNEEGRPPIPSDTGVRGLTESDPCFEGSALFRFPACKTYLTVDPRQAQGPPRGEEAREVGVSSRIGWDMMLVVRDDRFPGVWAHRRAAPSVIVCATAVVQPVGRRTSRRSRSARGEVPEGGDCGGVPVWRGALPLGLRPVCRWRDCDEIAGSRRLERRRRCEPHECGFGPARLLVEAPASNECSGTSSHRDDAGPGCASAVTFPRWYPRPRGGDPGGERLAGRARATCCACLIELEPRLVMWRDNASPAREWKAMRRGGQADLRPTEWSGNMPKPNPPSRAREPLGKERGHGRLRPRLP
jgi:hypothetical protein